MAEEARLLRTNRLDLGAVHENSCAAEDLRNSHRGHCAEGVVDSPEK